MPIGFEEAMNTQPHSVAIYCRCSTTEERQDVQSQVDACTKYCAAQSWTYRVFTEYESAYRLKRRPVFEDVLERLRLKEHNALMVYMLDRFSRQKPTQIVSDLHRITDSYGARFISLKEGIDSQQPMWEIVMMVFAYMANSYSKMLGVRVREGIQAKKAKNEYHGGRPVKRVDAARLKALVNGGKLPLRRLAAVYNADLPKAQRVSYQTLRKTLATL